MYAITKGFTWMPVTALMAACGGGGGGDTPPGTGQPDQATRIAAAEQTATTNANCTAVSPFYYELGDKNGAIVSGSVGTGYSATTQMNIASASKWLFGAYVAEVRNGVLSQDDTRATHMLSGYASMGSGCLPNATVESCFQMLGNDTYTAAKLDRYNYDSGHFQRWGVDNGMAAMDGDGVASAYRTTLGVETSFNGPLLAGGAITSASNYAVFLRKILNNQLEIAGLLGDQPVCTQPGLSCPTADRSPITAEAWSYSVGHWVETDPVVGDGAFSSAGAFGFYPWVDSTKTWYGILAREDMSGNNQGYASAQCGRLIRKAYMTGTAQ
ncbi:MAG: hypothetical protein KJ634_13870 [Gammaproteobacteria bacterium]|nr:hypothetical protein [Gammaproteobacteria bacterium]MBU1416703.1 hypothetical protein [Gammaproteobacteria bacterium]